PQFFFALKTFSRRRRSFFFWSISIEEINVMLYILTSTVYRCIIILFGVLYPAFSSYKALNKRDGYEQVKWMMYWIVFAAFTAVEVVTDILLCWLPLYNEAKILFVLWMVLPMTRGSSFLYRRIIHPNLLKHENEIERYIASASNKGCEVLFEVGQQGMNIAATAVLRTADRLKRSYSVGDVSGNPKTPSGRPIQQTVLRPVTADPARAGRSRPTARDTSHLSRFSASSSSLNATEPSQSFHDVLARQATKRAKNALYKVEEESGH
ncbi:hypothetical protein BOX15_Mlig019595g1, partial [Macrostomum lignano]